MHIRVELDVFSGRPNPTWMLTPDECKELLGRLDGLPGLPGSDWKPAPESLGYRGFKLVIVPKEPGGVQYEVSVFHDIITVRKETEKYYTDKHGLEQWLRQQAVGKGYGALMDSLGGK